MSGFDTILKICTGLCQILLKSIVLSGMLEKHPAGGRHIQIPPAASRGSLCVSLVLKQYVISKKTTDTKKRN